MVTENIELSVWRRILTLILFKFMVFMVTMYYLVLFKFVVSIEKNILMCLFAEENIFVGIFLKFVVSITSQIGSSV